MWRMDFNDVCGQIVERLDGALGCALVDLETGLPLALSARSDSLVTAAALEMICASAVACFSGGVGDRPVRESSDAGHAAAEAEKRPRRIQVTTELTYNFMALVPGGGNFLLVLVTNRGDTNLGLGWMAVRQAMEQLGDI